MMKTDRELIELAAQAAGVPLKWPFDPATYARVDGVPPRRTDTWENWNPLKDDGDALRLAVTLRLGLEWWKTGVSAESPQRGPSEIQHFEGDPQSATRRAIVRAAAAMAAAPAVG